MVGDRKSKGPDSDQKQSIPKSRTWRVEEGESVRELGIQEELEREPKY